MKRKIVSIIGTGVIGAGWAARFLAKGYVVKAYDPNKESLEKLKKNIQTAFKSLKKLGLNKNASLKNLNVFTNLNDALHETTFVQENAPESERIKKNILKTIDNIIPKNVIIASSSSGLLPSKIQSACKFPERVLIGHPFNPVYLLPLVEIVAGKKTSHTNVKKLKKLYEHIGMRPLIVQKEIEGYISDRLQEALWREALHIINDGVASTEEVDDAIVYGPGLRWAFMGVCLTFHLAGGETGMKHMLEQFGPALKLPWTRLKAPELTKDLRDKMVKGCLEMAGDEHFEKMAEDRDKKIVAVLNAIKSK